MPVLRLSNFHSPLLADEMVPAAFGPLDLLFPLLAFALTTGLTPLVAWFARRRGFVARARSDRWHKKPTALLGGIAIFLSFLCATLLAVKLTASILLVLSTSALVFCVGLIDDLRHLSARQKLVGQLLGAGILVSASLGIPWMAWALVNQLLAIFWLVGITNAINLLDNMDGLAAGVSAIAAAFIGISIALQGKFADALMMAILMGSLLGFLIYNSNPASIFMGDSGALFLGFLLASGGLISIHDWPHQSSLPVLAVPVLILIIPIFDTTLVTILRKRAGRAVSQGGTDHASHRLVALGFGERFAVWLLYLLATAAGLLSLAMQTLPAQFSIPLALAFCACLLLLGIRLARVECYQAKKPDSGTVQDGPTA
jgi:UDP-GlcNAc:undecaprenyl-phosphate GlcNAc-1-phosphate transferase